LQDSGAQAGHLEHLVVGHPRQLAGVGHDVGIGGVDAVDVGVDLAHVGLETGGQGHRGEIGAAATQRGDLVHVARALEAGHHGDGAGVQRGPHALGGDARDACLGVGAIGAQAGLGAGERARLEAEILQRQGQQGDRHLLAGGQQHVQFARVGRVRDLARETEQPVRRLAHGGDDDDRLVSGGALGHAAGDALDLLGVGDR
jgi:hypothetical protein